MTENERFELCMNDNGQLDIIDHVESEEKNAICIYNDLGVPPFSSAKALCDKLNEQDKRIKELEYELNEFKPVILNMEKGAILLYHKDYEIKTAEDYNEFLEELSTENSELKKQIESKEKAIRAFEDYINILKEDGVLDD